jgi:hypothetical protein
MPLTPFVRNHAFDQEAIQAMSTAFQHACRRLGLNDQDDPLNGLVAKRVVELARTGVRNRITLYMLTVKEFKAVA